MKTLSREPTECVWWIEFAIGLLPISFRLLISYTVERECVLVCVVISCLVLNARDLLVYVQCMIRISTMLGRKIRPIFKSVSNCVCVCVHCSSSKNKLADDLYRAKARQRRKKISNLVVIKTSKEKPH